MLPITFVGGNLGDRHRHLNTLVNTYSTQNISFNDVQKQKETSLVDRLFKIDLALKLKYVDYIIENLKDVDMLFVSRALKCPWLVREDVYRHIVNPVHLEEVLFPDMSVTAVCKLKLFIRKNLNDETRCEEFYHYYKAENWEYGHHFLSKCDKKFILKEIESISLEQISPKFLKLLSEKCPQISDYYYKSLRKNKKAVFHYLYNEKKFFDNTKHLLKEKPDTFFYTVENYFHRNKFNKFSIKMTKYVMRNHKDRVMAKPELYTRWVLNLKVAAKYFTEEEVKYVVKCLARAQYLERWFKYENVEPLLKTLQREDRIRFKKEIFVTKDIGELHSLPSYELPEPPRFKRDKQLFSESEEDDDTEEVVSFRKCVKKRKYCKYKIVGKRRTLLDELFDKYRFFNFHKTLYELKKRLASETSPDNRMMIMNVLVSKSGGLQEQVATLLEFLVERHRNEPSHVRAAVVRSLVHRARIYKLSETIWNLLNTWSHDLTSSLCTPLTHARIIRSALNLQTLPDVTVQDYLQHFVTFEEYKLTSPERCVVLEYVQKLITEKINKFIEERNALNAVEHIWMLFSVVKARHCKVNDDTELLSMLKAVSALDPDLSEPIITHTYKTRVFRRELFKEHFAKLSDVNIYLKALKVEVSLLEHKDKFQEIIVKGELMHERFLSKLAIYYEKDLAKYYLDILKSTDISEIRTSGKIFSNIGRHICILQSLDESFALVDQLKSEGSMKLARHIMSNIHMSRPKIYFTMSSIETLPLLTVGNILRSTSKSTARRYLHEVMTIKRPGCGKLGLWLALHVLSPSELELILSQVHHRCTAYAVSQSLQYVLRVKKCDENVWKKILNLMKSVNWKVNGDLRTKCLELIPKLPSLLKPEYCMILFNCNKELMTKRDALPLLYNFSRYMNKLNYDFIVTVLSEFIENECNDENMKNSNENYVGDYMEAYIKMIAKFLVLFREGDAFKTVGYRLFQKFSEMPMYTLESSYHPSMRDNLLIFLDSLMMPKLFLIQSETNLLTVFESILQEMRKFLPLEMNLTLYMRVHITMIYVKTINQAVKQGLDLSVNEQQVIGAIFGSYIAKELDVLVSTYFVTIRELFYLEMKSFCDTFFLGDSLQDFFKAFGDSLIASGSPHAAILVIYLIEHLVISRHVNYFLQLLTSMDNTEVAFYLNNYCIE